MSESHKKNDLLNKHENTFGISVVYQHRLYISTNYISAQIIYQHRLYTSTNYISAQIAYPQVTRGGGIMTMQLNNRIIYLSKNSTFNSSSLLHSSMLENNFDLSDAPLTNHFACCFSSDNFCLGCAE